MKQKRILQVLVGLVLCICLLMTTAMATPQRTLKRDCAGSDVKELQQQLVNLGYMQQKYTTGYYGSITENAVKTYQKAKGLTVDGIAGPQTLSKLFSSSTTSSTTTKLDTSKVYRLYDESSGVKAMQQALVNLGYMQQKHTTGYFGSLTLAAVKSFQKNNNLTVDGVAGYNTLSKLNSSSAKSSSSSSGSTSSSSSSSSTTVSTYIAKPGTLRLGDRGSEVTTLQQTLASKKYYSGSATGIFDSKTKTAVINFQKANGLVADGIVGSKTNAKLYATAAASASSKYTSADTSAIKEAVAAFSQTQKDEVYLLAQLITCEAGNEPYEGQVAVGNVVMNRVKNAGSNVRSIIYAHSGTSYQFAPAKNGSINRTPYTSCYNAAVEAYMGADPVGKSLFFCNPTVTPNAWQIKNRPFYKKIGSHSFYL